MEAPPAVILVETKYFPLQWVFYFCTPRISIDGWPPAPFKWGQHPFTVAPGPHRVEVYVPYLFLSRLGANSVDFQVAPGDLAQITWKAPWMTLLPGPIRTQYHPGAALAYAGAPAFGYQPPMALPTGPEGWFPDPAQRHELRWFDGYAWTPGVSDAGVQSADPI